MKYTVNETKSLLDIIEEVVPGYEGTIQDFIDSYDVTLNGFDGRVFFSCLTSNDEEFAVCFVGEVPQRFRYSENTESILGF